MLLILDGWGYRQPVTPDNAIENGNTPNWHSYLKEYPHSLIETYGLAVGLPEGQKVAALIPMGYPEGDAPAAPKRKAAEELVSFI